MAISNPNDSFVNTRATGSRLGPLDWIALIVLVIGGLNWALVGLFNFDLVATLFGSMSTASRAVYLLVGLAALYVLIVACMPRGFTRPRTAA